VSELAAGTMAFGGEADEATSRALFNRCRDAGINFFDCANMYGRGRAETILGRLVADCRDQVIIATKAYFAMGDGPNDRGSNRYHLTNAVDASLRRLGTDRIDVFFLHRYDDDTDLEDTLRTLDDLVRAGKILYPAVSNFSAWQAEKALGIAQCRGFAPVTCTQPMYNLVKRTAEVEILPQAAASGLGVFPYSPLGGGLLTGKYGSSRRPAKGRLVDYERYKIRYGNPSVYEVAEAFCGIADEMGVHPVSLAIAWVGNHPAVTAPLIGARNLEQLEPALAAVDIDMTPQLRARISALGPQPPSPTDRNDEAFDLDDFGKKRRNK